MSVFVRLLHPYFVFWDSRGCDHMIIGFTTTCAISAYHH